jgi:ATP/ADP translocase
VLFDVRQKNKIMKTMSQIVAGGGWHGNRIHRIKIKAWISLIIAIAFGGLSIASMESILFYACIPSVVMLIISVSLFVRENPIQIESLSGRVRTDPSKLYGRSSSSGAIPPKNMAEQDAPSNR